MGEIYANNAKGKLALAASDAATTLELEPGHSLPALEPGDWFRLTLYRWQFWEEGIREYDHEVVKVTDVAGDTLTVERSLEGAAQSFDAGTNAELRPTAGTVEAVRADAEQALFGHANRTDNPHAVTAGQVGADPVGAAAGAVSAHEAAVNPHPQYATGGAQDTHSGLTNNPHSVTAAQVGAVALTGNQTVAGVKTFSSLPQTSNTALAKGFHNITISSAAPSGGADGDVWLKY